MRRIIPFVSIVLATLCSQPACAAIVTTIADSGPGSLRQAIASATPGASRTVAGTPDFRIFDIRSGTVTISGLTVNNGRSDLGGGVLIQARGDLTMHDL